MQRASGIIAQGDSNTPTWSQMAHHKTYKAPASNQKPEAPPVSLQIHPRDLHNPRRKLSLRIHSRPMHSYR
eukprot:599684-Pyramimonas_sp.AAC.1